ncbi:hypothetical protein V5O48_012916 [Marasmius crinis-equi]|uniref:Uncharacterized protein n=1 Tax=Marasmius crinis-equi TaxID=585013 RepID=A0ABR3F1I3_9AGAR
MCRQRTRWGSVAGKEEIESLSAQIVKTEGEIHVAKRVIEKAQRDARESLGNSDDRFKGVAENLNRLQEIAKADNGQLED